MPAPRIPVNHDDADFQQGGVTGIKVNFAAEMNWRELTCNL